MKIKDFTKPKFLLCELPIKNGSSDDDRLWIYCVDNLSLIEAISLEDVEYLSLEVEHKYYTYNDERWVLAFVQNNAEATGSEPEAVLDDAWEFLKDYFNWENYNIDEDFTAKMN